MHQPDADDESTHVWKAAKSGAAMTAAYSPKILPVAVLANLDSMNGGIPTLDSHRTRDPKAT